MKDRYLTCNSTSRQSILTFFLALLMTLLAVSRVNAQNDTYTPLGLTPGAPAGSYPLSDVDNVNLFNGLVNIRIPLYNYAGRGEAKTQSSFTWDSPMRWQVYKSSDPDGNPIYGAGIGGNRPDGSTSYGGHSGEISVFPQGVGTGAANWCSEGLYAWGGHTLTRLFWVDADGNEHEMRDVLTGGQPQTSGGCWSQGANRGKVFVSTDGSGATFIADDPIRDGVYVNMEFPYGSDWDGWLLLKDGRRIRISYGSDRGIKDRNGNLLTTVPNQPVKDSLNRTMGSGYGTSPECPSGCSYSTYKGFNGATRKIQFLNDANYRLERIFLPNGLSYRLYYSVYDDITRIDLPTGGSIEYDYAAGLTGAQPDGSFVSGAPAGVYSGGPSDFHIYRRVVERRVYREGHVLESRQTFSIPEDVYQNNLGYVDKKQYAANGALLSTERHYFYGSAEHSFWIQPLDYSPWKHGREYRTEFYDANGNLLRKIEHTWEQRAPVSWWTGSSDDAPANDPRISQTVTYLENGMSSSTTYSYDPTVPYNSLTDVYVRDYNGALLRRTQTTYLKNLNSIDYTGSNIQSASSIHLRDFPLQVSIYDGAGVERARTTYEYDNYNTDSNHAGLVARTGTSGSDSTFSTSYTTRANVTGTTRYLLTNGAVTGSISAYVQYDIAGNVVKTIDPRGCATQLSYNDDFGSPNGEARSNTAPSELAGQTSFAFPTTVSNCLGHTSFTQFDFNLGRPVDSEDANGVVSSGYFDDLLDRPTKIVRGVTTGAENQTLFVYTDVARTITTSSDRDNPGDGLLVSDVRYDGLGRTTETRQYEGSGKYIAVQTQYDALGRAYKASNPFRPLSPDNETAVWTTTGFDALGRVISVTTPDGAVASTYYNGNQVLVRDPAGMERMSEANATGQLKTLWEITSSDS
jgi:YD repeat-containing protein